MSDGDAIVISFNEYVTTDMKSVDRVKRNVAVHDRVYGRNIIRQKNVDTVTYILSDYKTVTREL